LYSRSLDYDNDPANFSSFERAVIGLTWASVAEDFAPFHVDVTTEEPVLDDIVKTDIHDYRYGIRVVITPDAFREAGGVAFLNSFGVPIDNPAFAFTANYDYDDSAIIISHEAGHALGLDHDGTSTAEYYVGHDGWGPIMGAAYGAAIQQWSKGEYWDANNKEDDTAIIAENAQPVTDDAPDSRELSGVLPASSFVGTISTPADKDWYKVTLNSQSLSISVAPPLATDPYSANQTWVAANLDPAVELWKGGTLVERLDQPGVTISKSFTGLTPGTYYLMVEGVGFSDPMDDGYSDYGSLGNYLLSTTGDVVTSARADGAATASTGEARPGVPVTFTASSPSHDLSDLNLAWTFSDGSASTAATPTVDMPRQGALTALLTATTSEGTITYASVTVQPFLKAPVVRGIDCDGSGLPAGTWVMCRAYAYDPDATDPDPFGWNMTYRWVSSSGETSDSDLGWFSPQTAGVYTATVTVTDPDGLTVTDSVEFTLTPNTPPVFTTTSFSSTSFVSPSSVTFTARATDAESKPSSILYFWDFPDDSYTTGASVRKVLKGSGPQSVVVTAIDESGLRVSRTLVVTLKPNTAPLVSSASVSAATMPAPAKLTFRTSASDPDKQALTYSWVFSDGSTATGAAPIKTITTPGSYTATVTATDTGNLSASKSVSFIITENHAPTVALKRAPASTQVAPALFALTATGSDVDKQSLTYTWEFSDGTTATGATVIKKLTTAASVTATVTASDPGGLTASASTTLTATANQAPTLEVASAGGLSKPAPATFALTATGTDPDKQALTYKWVFSDKSTATGAAVSKKWTSPGTYTATVTVTDAGGLSTSKVVSLVVTENRAPVISSATASPSVALARASRKFSVSASDPDAQALTYRWVFHDRTTSTAASVSKAFAVKGSYTASVTVTDTGGLSTTSLVAYTVS
jgi:PKD repeat protein